MRRIALLLLMAFQILFLQACTDNSLKAEKIVFSFSCKAECKVGAVSAVCSLERPGAEMLHCTVTSPMELSSMEYNWSGKDFSITYAGISAQSERCPLPPNNFALLLKETLDYASRTDVLMSAKENTFTGSFENVPFTIRVNPDTGEIQEVLIPQKKFYAKFYEYKTKNAG